MKALKKTPSAETSSGKLSKKDITSTGGGAGEKVRHQRRARK